MTHDATKRAVEAWERIAGRGDYDYSDGWDDWTADALQLADAIKAAGGLAAMLERAREEGRREGFAARASDQPIVRERNGVVRFKANPIVRDLLDWASAVHPAPSLRMLELRARFPQSFSLNEIARNGYGAEEQTQFAQLIGYSICGYSELEYVSDSDYERAAAIADELMGKWKAAKELERRMKGATNADR